jgi:hypothetical protein
MPQAIQQPREMLRNRRSTKLRSRDALEEFGQNCSLALSLLKLFTYHAESPLALLEC